METSMDKANSKYWCFVSAVASVRLPITEARGIRPPPGLNSACMPHRNVALTREMLLEAED
jgi:hypothetical protein